MCIRDKIEDGPLAHRATPEGLSGTHMKSDLRHQEGLADFRRSGKDVRPCVEQIFNDHGLALEYMVHQLVQGHSMEVSRVCLLYTSRCV